MSEALPEGALEAEFDAFIARAGLTIPDDRREALLKAFADLRGQISLLHAPRPVTTEPANVFRVPPVEATR